MLQRKPCECYSRSVVHCSANSTQRIPFPLLICQSKETSHVQRNSVSPRDNLLGILQINLSISPGLLRPNKNHTPPLGDKGGFGSAVCMQPQESAGSCLPPRKSMLQFCGLNQARGLIRKSRSGIRLISGCCQIALTKSFAICACVEPFTLLTARVKLTTREECLLLPDNL